MEKIEQFLEDRRQALIAFKSSEQDMNKVAQKNFEFGQLLMNIGEQQSALEYIEYSFNHFSKVPKESNGLCDSLFSIVGICYIQILDYLNNIQKCDEVFRILTERDPNGTHLGDYAFFLHRRKRDFDNAER
jgi:tetratricopeptide (TPR) repeat protein